MPKDTPPSLSVAVAIAPHSSEEQAVQRFTAQLIMHMQALPQGAHPGTFLKEGIACISQQSLYLVLYEGTLGLPHIDQHEAAARCRVTVEWDGFIFGALCAAPTNAPLQATMALLEPLAQTCGWLLHHLSYSAFVQRRVPTYSPALAQNVASLSPTERGILRLLLQGPKPAQIAALLKKARGTILSHQRRMYLKLGVKVVQDAILIGIATRLGL